MLDQHGNWLPVTDLHETGASEPVYNCRVAEYHTYFTGQSTDGPWAVWAHNYGVEAQRRAAVRKAWKLEADMVKKKGQGSRNWTKSEMRELLRTGRVKGYQGHHVNSVNAHPHLASNPDNIAFFKRGDHLLQHSGNWRTPTSGPLIPR